jgi:predicted nucleotidyltransferase
MKDPNGLLFEAAARLLRPLLNDLVFLGGSATGLLITDQAAPGVRATDDVDVITEVGSYAQYETLSERLRKIGLTEDMSDGAPMCRWRHGDLIIDVMPTDASILGFGNRWYKPAIRAARRMEVAGLHVQVITPPYFVATKFEAFHERGENDVVGSHDLEDIVTVIDGRAEIVDDVRAAQFDVRTFISSEIDHLLSTDPFLYSLPGFLLPDPASQARLPILLERLHALAALRQ